MFSKRNILSVIAICLFTSAGIFSDDSTKKNLKVVNSGGSRLPVRSTPDINGAVEFQLKDGERVEVLEEAAEETEVSEVKGKWLRVTQDKGFGDSSRFVKNVNGKMVNKEGWVFSAFLVEYVSEEQQIAAQEAVDAKAQAENSEAIAAANAARTLHKFKLGAIQKNRLFADTKKRLREQGISGQQYETRLKGAKIVYDSMRPESMMIELKDNGILIYTQEGTVKLLTYRINGKFLEVQNKETNEWKKLGRFNGSKTILEILDHITGTVVAATLQK